MKITEIISLSEAYYSSDRREQQSMDNSRRQFKRAEMQHELGHETEHDHSPPPAQSIFYITINGKLWKKNGVPVQFNGVSHANAVANKLIARDATNQVQVTSVATEEFSLQENAQYDEAERILADAKIAKENNQLAEFNTLMADYHDQLVQWHESKGRYNAADSEAKKVEQYHAAARAYF